MKRQNIITGICVFLCSFLLFAEEEIKKIDSMNNQRIDKLIRNVDKNAKGKNGIWQFEIEKHLVLVVTDEKADRMRIFTQVAESKKLSQKLLFRMMQANFDSALDARYAIANDKLWSAFIHPLSPLTENQFFSGLAQVVTLAATYGTTFSSGALIFRGGDSEQLNRELYERILKKGKST